MPEVTLYVLKGESGKRYVGITSDIERRLYDHKLGRTKGGQVLGKFSLILTETYPDHATARMREKFLKSGQGRKWLDEQEIKPVASSY
jgi:putative endonuclease